MDTESVFIFPGDPEYDRPNRARDWHYLLLVLSVPLIFFLGVPVLATNGTPIVLGMALAFFVVTFFTAPDDPRYP